MGPFMNAEELVVTLAPVAVYWVYAGIYELLLARTTVLDKYRLHSRRDEETKNIASRKDVVRGVLLQQAIQVAISVAVLKADVEVSFELDASSLEKAEAFDPAYDNDAQKLCGVKGADVKGGVGPFGLWVLASADLQEKTAVFFRVFKDGYGKPKVLMCSDPTKSSLSTDLYKPTFAGFVHTDISSSKIALRSLIDRSVVESFGAGGRTCILSRVYPSIAIGKDAHLYVFNNGDVESKCQA